MKKHYILFLAMIVGASSGFAQEISNEDAFYYYLKVNRINIGAEMPNRLALKPDNYITYYAKTFDKANYNQKINDEFEKHEYGKKLTSKLASGISFVKFGTQYTSSSYLKLNGSYYGATLGEYSFSTNSFPIIFNEPPRIMLYNDPSINFQIIGNILNKEDFDFALKMPMETAKEIISRRKDASGKIDRSVFVNFVYSVLNNDSGLNKDGKVNVYLHQIYILGDKQFTPLGSILPTFDWHDKILGVRIKNVEAGSTNPTEKSEPKSNSKDEGDKFLGTWIGDDPQCQKSSTKVIITKKEDGYYLIEFFYIGDCSDFDGYSFIGYFYDNQNKIIGLQKDYNSEVKLEFINSNKISIPLLAQDRTLYLHR